MLISSNCPIGQLSCLRLEYLITSLVFARISDHCERYTKPCLKRVLYASKAR
jgi:hypothetical protein